MEAQNDVDMASQSESELVDGENDDSKMDSTKDSLVPENQENSLIGAHIVWPIFWSI